MKLLSTANPKIQKGTAKGYLSFILHLAPATLSGYNIVYAQTPGTGASGLYTTNTTNQQQAQADSLKTEAKKIAAEMSISNCVATK